MAEKKMASVFEAEQQLLKQCLSISRNASQEELFDCLRLLTNAYAKLLRQTNKITRVGDSIQNKLVRAREEIHIKNQRLLATQQQLVHKEKMLAMGTLSQGLAHEICNPLNFINNFANLNLQLCGEIRARYRGTESPPEGAALEELLSNMEDLHHGAHIIQEQGRRAAAIVESMGHLGASSAAHKSQSRNEDLGYLLDSFASTVAGNYQAELGPNFVVVRQMSLNLPSVKVVAEDLGTVFVQLLNNACEALVERRKTEPDFLPRLFLASELVNHRAEFQIGDNGPGISEEDFGKIFTPFFSTKEAAANIGLGLTICYDVVVNGYGGELRVLHTKPGDTRFLLALPIAGS